VLEVRGRVWRDNGDQRGGGTRLLFINEGRGGHAIGDDGRM